MEVERLFSRPVVTLGPISDIGDFYLFGDFINCYIYNSDVPN